MSDQVGNPEDRFSRVTAHNTSVNHNKKRKSHFFLISNNRIPTTCTLFCLCNTENEILHDVKILPYVDEITETIQTDR